MGATLRHERDNIYRLEVSGRLRERDLDAVERSAADVIRRGGAIRLLVVLSRFEGWEEADNWRDLGFYVEHGHALERIAIVGEEQWRSQALMFAAADLRKGAVAFFPAAGSDQARAWLAA
jgi:hypothetical protein